MTFEEAVAARRSVRSFDDRTVPRRAVEKAIELAVQSPAPHHSAPWRFALFESFEERSKLSEVMAAKWKEDLSADGLAPERVEMILGRSHALLTGAPLVVICCADMSKAHDYSDERRQLGEWSLFAHTVGAALQTFMLSLAEGGIASCWVSAPVFCRDVVRQHLGAPPTVEPHALVLVGYADESYEPRPRPPQKATDYLIRG